MSDQPSQKDLHNYVVKEAARKWRVLGLELLPYEQHQVLNKIESDYPNDAVNCCKHVLYVWLATAKNATWNQLIRALRLPFVGLSDLADQLEEMMVKEREIYTVQLNSNLTLTLVSLAET